MGSLESMVYSDAKDESALAFTVICYALGRDLHHIMSHTDKKYYKKRKYEMQDPIALQTSLAKKFMERTKASAGSQNQPQEIKKF